MVTNRGQAVVETALTLSFFSLLLLAAMGLIFQAALTVMLKSWAARHSRCIAFKEIPSLCAAQTCSQLTKYFPLRDCVVRFKDSRGTITTDVRANLRFQVPGFPLGPMQAGFALYPYEYRRVQ